MDAISAVSTWSAMVNESSVLPFDEPDGEGCLDVGLSWTYQVSDGSRTARRGCAASGGIAVNLISRPVCDHQRF